MLNGAGKLGDDRRGSIGRGRWWIFLGIIHELRRARYLIASAKAQDKVMLFLGRIESFPF
jgi:hypothetical protein